MSLNPIEFIDIHCPYCDETFSISIDTSIHEQQYVEDCHVCCSAIFLNLCVDGDTEKAKVSVHRENE